MSHRTAEEAKDEYIQVMGKPLGTVFHALYNDTVLLYAKWREYVELYGTNQSRVDRLNQAAPLFFWVVEDTLWKETLLHMTRLTDPQYSGSRDKSNLTLQQLARRQPRRRKRSRDKSNLTLQQLPSLVDEKIKEKIKDLVDEAVRSTKFCRDWRNRLIAHSDLALATKPSATPLKAASREKVKKALGAIAKVLDAVTVHYCDSTTAFDLTIRVGGAEKLLRIIDDGLRAESERKTRMISGQMRASDIERRDL